MGIAAGAGAAAQIAGDVMSGIGASTAGNRMNDALQNEVKALIPFMVQTNQAVKKGIDASDPFNAQQEIATGTKRASDLYNQVEGVPTSLTPKGPSAGNDPRNQAWAHLVNAVKAPQQGYNEFTLQQMIKNLELARQMRLWSQQAQDSASVLPLTINAAKHSEDNLMGWGSVLQQIGGMGTNAGMMGI